MGFSIPHVLGIFIEHSSMDEMGKSHAARVRAGDYEWLRGDVLDLGASEWPIQLEPPSTVRAWDLEDGDAQLLEGVKNESFTVITASHLLEHLHDPEEAMRNWSRVLKEGGYVLAYVPCFSFYEKFHDFEYGTENAARFNPDHKTSWDLINLVRPPQNHRHFGYKEIVRMGKQAGLTLVDLRLELDGFHWDQAGNASFDQTMMGALAQWCMIFCKI